jgi:antitoxin HicB
VSFGHQPHSIATIHLTQNRHFWGFFCSSPIADGETVEEAIAHGYQALQATIEALEEKGFAVPAPNGGSVASGKFVARVPKSVHAELVTRAKTEGVSLNSLVLAILAEGLGRRARHSFS